jgi:hypothetical protein
MLERIAIFSLLVQNASGTTIRESNFINSECTTE